VIGKELNVLTMGFYSIIEMASAMPDIFRTERPFPNGDWLLFLAAKCRKGTVINYFTVKALRS
jgi:hypothetical protein